MNTRLDDIMVLHPYFTTVTTEKRNDAQISKLKVSFTSYDQEKINANFSYSNHEY